MSGNIFQEQLVDGGGKRTMQQLLKQTPDIDALFASSDQIARGAIHQPGRHVLQDLAVVGFDDTCEAVFSCPAHDNLPRLAKAGHFALQNLQPMIKPEGWSRPVQSNLKLTMTCFLFLII
jgi:DNA-binding LacI/PurR family transcriptional regulator